MYHSLALTFLVSLFFLIGFYISRIVLNKKKLLCITTSATFIIMIYLLACDLLPEIIEIMNPLENIKNICIILISVIFGITILKVLDLFIPEHHHEHKEVNDDLKSHNNHLFHIGVITAISLIIHNILEGISIYITGLGDLKSGIIMAITVGCHNLPLGIEISASLETNQSERKKKIIILLLLACSSFLGAFCLFLLGLELSEFIEGILLSITFGMLFYISIFELLPEVLKSRKEKDIKIGLFLGIVLVVILFWI